MPNDRSDAALRELLVIAEKATPKGEKTIWTADFASPHETCVRDAFTERILTMEDYTDQATAAHIAANHPDVVRADIEEILRLRQEVARLELENQRLTESRGVDRELGHAARRAMPVHLMTPEVPGQSYTLTDLDVASWGLLKLTHKGRA